MTFDLNLFMKAGPVASALVVGLLYWGYRAAKKKSISLEDIFVVGITGSAFPSGFLFIAAGFDPTLLARVAETPIYIALAGIAVLYISVKTLHEKSIA